MRIDKFLKVSRIIKRRTTAQSMCEAGIVLINGKTAKPSSAVKAGDIIDIVSPRSSRFQVLSADEQKGKDAVMIKQLDK